MTVNRPSRQLILPVLFAAGFLFNTACFLSSRQTEIPTYTAQKGEFRISVTESGELKAKQSTVIYSPRTRFGSVQIVKIVPEGEQVAEGDFVIQFDTTEPQKRIDDKVAALEMSQADLRKMNTDQSSRMKDLGHQLTNQEASLEMTQLKQDRMRFEAEAVRREVELEVTRARLAVDQAKEKIETQGKIDTEDLRKLKLQLQQVRNELELAQADMERLTVTAPAPGLVVYQKNWATDAKVQVGDTPWPGMPLIEIPDLSRMIAETQINEVDVSKMSEGQDVIVTLDAFPDKSFTGTVTSIATLATEKERRSSVKVFPLEAMLDSSDPIMKPGMTVKVEVVVERIPDVVSIPLEAVFEKNGAMICHVKRDGSFVERELVLGVRNEDFVVVESGVESGQKVALRDPTLPLESIGLPEDEQDGGGKRKAPAPISANEVFG